MAWVYGSLIGSDGIFYRRVLQIGRKNEEAAVVLNWGETGYWFQEWPSHMIYRVDPFDGEAGDLDEYYRLPQTLYRGEWHHLAATYEENSRVSKIYLDGVYGITGTGSGSVANVLRRLAIGNG
eukprot:1938754-Rhodomonas_salina.1